jgi:HEPN domain-containing protein
VTIRAKDWFSQVELDLEQAEASSVEGRHEWACFAAQQAAEKSVKALHLMLSLPSSPFFALQYHFFGRFF